MQSAAAAKETVRLSISQHQQDLEEKVYKIFSNPNEDNFETEAEKLMKTVDEKDIPRLVKIVTECVSKEVIHRHFLYAQIIDCLTARGVDFYHKVIREIYKCSNNLLSQKDTRSSKEFDDFLFKLKNVGHWLGLLTLARDKPIVYAYIDLKMLLIDAHHMEKQEGHSDLPFLVPFVAKVFQTVPKKARGVFWPIKGVYWPPNPYTVGILNVLKVIFGDQSLKVNLKVPIYVLFKKFKGDDELDFEAKSLQLLAYYTIYTCITDRNTKEQITDIRELPPHILPNEMISVIKRGF